PIHRRSFGPVRAAHEARAAIMLGGSIPLPVGLLQD
ncbi:ribonuclease HII, partial [Pseudomonas syringae pv. actinidiae ICMP 18804]